MENIFILLEFVTAIYFGIAGGYVFIFSVAGAINLPVSAEKHKLLHQKIAVLIPGYREDSVIIASAKAALSQNYPDHLFDVVIIADSFHKNTLRELKKLPVILIEVCFAQSTKSKALNKAMQILDTDYDLALILDADNIMEPCFLRKIAAGFNADTHVVQARRIAKNLNSSFAILDGISEEINNHIFRKGHRALGLSSGLIGSGMAFKYSYFKNLMKTNHAVGGFDKELEFEIFKKGHRIEFLNKALVFDEKIQNAKGFNNQRRRWLATQFVYLKKYFFAGIKESLRGNLDFADKLIQMVLPPRVLLLGAIAIIFGLYTISELLFNNIDTQFSSTYWCFILGSVSLAYLMAIPKKYYNTSTFRALFSLPRAFFLMFLLLFRLNGANKSFIHTIHKNNIK